MIKEAMVKMLDADEFDKMLKYEKNPFERRNIRQDKKTAEHIKEYGVEKVPEIMVMNSIKSVETFRDLICFLRKEDN